MNDGRFAGLVWYSIAPSETNRAILANSAVPVVIIHARAAEYDHRHPTVACDNAQGIGLAVDYLVENGHRRIAFGIESDALNVESMSRLEAFKVHMARHGLTVLDADILDVLRGREELHEYLRQGPRHTSVIAHADGLAADFIRTAPLYDVRIPEDLSVIGFDSTEFCDELRPTLTSISQPLYEMGAQAVDLLIQTVGDAAGTPVELILPCGLDVRGSTGPAGS